MPLQHRLGAALLLPPLRHRHHLQRRSDPACWAVKVACLDGVSPFGVAEVPVFDGIDHPAHTGGAARLAGTFRFDAGG